MFSLNLLATKGMPFREAHACAGKAVKYAQDKGKELHELELKELKSFSTLIQKDIFGFLSTKEIIDRRKSFGGTATKNVVEAIKNAEAELKKEKAKKAFV